MSAAAFASAVLVITVLGTLAFGPELAAATRRRGRRRSTGAGVALRDPGRELRAERRAHALLAGVVSGEELAMYDELGFLSVDGACDPGSGYAYLVYPHRPIVAYDTATGELLNEYCVTFPDRAEPAHAARLPDADDVLAKWMTLQGGERQLIATANMHVPGHQIDPGQIRRDLIRLREWRAARRRRAAA